jgi:molybdenum cofactor synthesis domain-containing protein
MTTDGIVVLSTNLSAAKGTIKQPQPEIEIDHNGVIGDAHAGPGLRQVSLLAQESIEQFARESGRSFAPGDFAENLTTRGLTIDAVSPLDRLRINAVSLEVTQVGKQCHGEGCAIFREIGRCVMPKEGIFTRVLDGGKVKPGDSLTHSRRVLTTWVITVSDRASIGQYQDRSGPRIMELLQQHMSGNAWQLECRNTIVPDEPHELTALLEQAENADVDVVVTTGGTGIGPRDITPDVVKEHLSKELPGIMEYIRVTYGREHPAALLSRSVAGVMGRSLVYTLPGSVRAVEQYMAELLKTMEHLIYTLRGLDIHP